MANHKSSASSRTIIASSINPTPREVYRAAKAYVEAGLSFIPISANLTKRPAFNLLPRIPSEDDWDDRPVWKVFRERRPTNDELHRWYGRQDYLHEYGIAVLAGRISGSLEILDLDNWDVVTAFEHEMSCRAPGLMNRLVRVITPRPGMHCYYRCEEIGGNQKLARVIDPNSPKGAPRPKTVIEIKGEGGYCLAPPSPRRCHPKKQCYRHADALDLTAIPTITKRERTTLIDTARSFGTWTEVDRGRPVLTHYPPSHTNNARPGDDFNVRANWAEILEPHGWRFVSGQPDGSCTWCRPQKQEGGSATTNYHGVDRLYVFSTNAHPFESEKSYSKFQAYTLLNHDGDFASAAHELRIQGYGAKVPRRRQRSRKDSWLDDYSGFKR